MNKLTINPNNSKWYSEDFIKGFECGVERQFEKDKAELNNIVEQTDGDLISRDFMKKLGATCIAKRNETGELVAISSIDYLPSAEKTTINNEKTTITDTDLISRESVITMLQKIENAVEDGDGFQFNEWVEYAKDIPNAEKTAVFKIVGNTKQPYECSKCNEPVDGWDKFCKHCGARLVL